MIFYDIERSKFIATCEIENVQSYCVVGEELIIGIGEEWTKPKYFKKITLPFSQESRNADFWFYTPIDSIFPEPFTSIDDLIPANSL